MSEESSNVPKELDHHDGERCNYACWSTEPRSVSNATAYGTKGNSRWARMRHTVTVVANTIFGCSCDSEGVCKHIEHVIITDWRGCIEYHPIEDRERIGELKAFSRARRRQLYNDAIDSQ